MATNGNEGQAMAFLMLLVLAGILLSAIAGVNVQWVVIVFAGLKIIQMAGGGGK